MFAASGLRLLLQEVGTVKLSAAACAVLSTTCKACRNAHQRPWYVTVAKIQLVSLYSQPTPRFREEEAGAPELTLELQQAKLPDADAFPRRQYRRNPTEVSSTSQQLYFSKAADLFLLFLNCCPGYDSQPSHSCCKAPELQDHDYSTTCCSSHA